MSDFSSRRAYSMWRFVRQEKIECLQGGAKRFAIRCENRAVRIRRAHARAGFAMDARVEGPVTLDAFRIAGIGVALQRTACPVDGFLVARARTTRQPRVIAEHQRIARFPFQTCRPLGFALIRDGPCFPQAFVACGVIASTAAAAAGARPSTAARRRAARR